MSLDSILDRLAGQLVIPRRKKRLRAARFHVEALEARVLLTTYTVTSTDPFFNTAPFDPQNTGLEVALVHVNFAPNSDGQPDVINFKIQGGGVQTIKVPSPAAASLIFNHTVTIDGTTQFGYTPGHPMIDIDGSNAGNDDGLTFKAGGNAVKGLIINNFKGFGIVLDGTNDSAHNAGPGINNTIQGNFIGTDKTGMTAAPNGLGIDIFNSSFNLIGGVVLPTGQFANGNLISGNSQSGVLLDTATDTHNYIDGNYIGTDVTGKNPLPNKLDGVALVPPLGLASFGFASNNFIGGVIPVTNQLSPVAGNVIAGNTQDGVLIVGGSGNQVAANLIGVGADGTTPVPNGHDGVHLEDASSNIVGGTNTAARNFISGNLNDGLQIVSDTATEQGLAIPVANQGAASNLVLGNYIGTDESGTQTLANANAGVEINNFTSRPTGPLNNIIGGSSAGAGNVISGNGSPASGNSPATGEGVLIANDQNGNTLEGNYIGTTANGLGKRPNSTGVVISNAANNLIGDGNAGNVISGNILAGVVVTGNLSTGNYLQNNRIGMSKDLSQPLANHDGVVIQGLASKNFVGNVTTDDGLMGNTIAGNTANGVLIQDGAFSNQVLANGFGIVEFLTGGEPPLGTPLPTNGTGIEILNAHDNIIGGASRASRNFVDNSVADGIDINDTNGIAGKSPVVTTGNIVEGNYIGVKNDGANDLGNFGSGVLIAGAAGSVIGGLLPGAGNVISGNLQDGVLITGQTATGNKIAGNRIGTTADGTAAVPNKSGVEVSAGAAQNFIGLVGDSGRNVISGNSFNGVIINGAGQSNHVQNNYIGLNAQGTVAPTNSPTKNNQLFGIGVLDSQNTFIGGTDPSLRNVVSGNTTADIGISNGSSGTQVLGNYVGTNQDATNTIANNGLGIAVATSTGSKSPAPTNVIISGNTIGGTQGAILLTGGTGNDQILGNYVGENANIVPLPNTGIGIEIDSSQGNTVGGPGNARNFVLDTQKGTSTHPDAGSGIVIDGSAPHANGTLPKPNTVANNTVEGNQDDGIVLRNGATNDLIGTAGLGNTIILNQSFGVDIYGKGTNSNQLRANLIGIDSTGSPSDSGTPEANVDGGVLINTLASNNIIGDQVIGAANVISANKVGVELFDGAAENSIIGNLIGTTAKGTVQPGFGNGIGITSAAAGSNTIGGPTGIPGLGAGNKILGNKTGIFFDGGSDVEGDTQYNDQGRNKVQGNLIANNTIDGVDFVGAASNNLIGGSDIVDANSIHDNGSDGVFVQLGTGNSILHNSIFNNTGLGIHLGQIGRGNDLLAAPHLSLATTGQSNRVAGWLQAAPKTKYTIEIFDGPLSADNNPKNDDAENLFQAITVTTDSNGFFPFDLQTTGGQGFSFVATATVITASGFGDTSQFSKAVAALPDSDGDGEPDSIEANAAGVTKAKGTVSFQDAVDPTKYVTLEAPKASDTASQVTFQNAWSTPMPAPPDKGGPPSDTVFPLGFASFTLVNTPVTQQGQPVPFVVTMILPPGTPTPNSYWRYGKTPDNQTSHWYNWLFGQEPHGTGAEIRGNTILLHFLDGDFGDDDGNPNDRKIVDPGSPGFPDPYTVTTTADSGPGSLRQAILNANANPLNTITFDLPGSGPQTIELLSPLPAITAGVTIDGSTEPGFAGTPLVVLDGSQAGAGADGLTVASGFATIQDLVINHFSGDGIHVLGAGSALIAGNFIGTDASGKVAQGNGRYGVEIDADTPDAIDPDNDGDDDNAADNKDTDGDATSGPPSTIGGGNVISSNLAGGISIHGSLAKKNQITNNLIGTQADGTSPLGNGGPGVVIDGGSNGNTIGSQPKSGNTIAFNAGPGVEILKGIDNLIESNSIFANQGIGIELASGGNANESQSAPVLASAASYGGETFVSGTLTSTANSSFTIDFYATDQAGQSGGPQGQSLLGSVTVTTDTNGQASFDATLAASAASGSLITATASLNDNETSEFSAGLALTPTNPMVLIVNTGSDVPDQDCGLFTLRQAIVAANAHPGQDIIDFDLPNSGRVIQPQSALPAITDPVIIDGTSQPGYQGLPLVEIDGSKAGAGADGLHITGGGSIVRGLAIHSFSGSGIELSGPGGNTLEGNFLGTDVTGTSGMPDRGGNSFVNGAAGGDVFINGSPDNLIGGTTAATRNIILSVDVTGGGATGNRIEGNYVGADLTGTALLSNSGLVGVDVSAPSNTIGGLAAGAGNVIEGGVGILNTSNNVVQGNLIGTDVTGTVYLSAAVGGGQVDNVGGVAIRGDDNTSSFSSHNLIGGTTAAARNIIAGGVDLSGAAIYNLVQGNYLGTDITGTVSLSGFGVSFDETSSNEIPAFNTIGGPEPGAGNLISGTVFMGISLNGHNNTIQGNRIGTDVTGTKALDNIGYGITDGGEDNTIGGDLPGEGNLISGNEEGGIISGTGDTVEGNLIGTDYTGTIAIGNGYGPNASSGNDDGIEVAANNVTIGGPQPGAGNVISDSAANGIAVTGVTPHTGLVIQGNFIGTDITGTKALGNRGDGITVNEEPLLNGIIGGASPGAGNVISANGGDGIRISDPLLLANGGQISSGNIIQGNKIGTDVTGTRALGNAGDGVSIVISNLLASDETIGGTDPGAGNTIAFNGGRGVDIPFGNGNTVRGNDIFDNGGPGLITDINAAVSTYAENRGVQLTQPAPVLSSAVFEPQGTVVSGTLTGTPFTRFDVDFFANDKVNATGLGDGQTYLQSISVLVDNTGSVQFQIPLDTAVPIGQWITATATPAPSPSGPVPIPEPNISLFSQGVPVVAAIDASDIQFSAPTYLVTEAGGSAVIVVTRSGDTSGTAKVDYATRDGSAAAGVNYTAETGTLTFATGVTSQTITVPVADDGQADGTKDFHILLSNVNGANLGAVNTADVTIADSNSAGTIQFASSSYYVDKVLELQSQEQGNPPASTFTLTRTGGSHGAVSVEFRVTGGTAGNNMDYQDNFGTVVFAPGQTTAQITFGYAYNFINNNRETPVYRGPQTLQVTIGNPTGDAVLGPITTSVVTIDDPEDQNGAFEIKSQLQVKENAGQAVIEVDRLGQTSTTEEVSYSTVDGTAKAGTNYVATSGTLIFQPGQTQADIDVPILDDHLNDNPGTFQVVLSNPTGGALVLPALGQATVTILNSGVVPPSDILVVETVNNADTLAGFIESSGTALITVERVNPVTGLADGGGAAGGVQVNYATSDGTARAGSDYTAESGTLFFGAGQVDAYISVPLLPGNDYPDTRTFLVTLSNVVGNAVVGADNPVTETIHGIPGQIDITSPTYTVAENKAALTVSVALNRLPGVDPEVSIGNVTVDYATHDGTATAGADYTAVSGTLKLNDRGFALPSAATITIPILNDQLLEQGPTTFYLTLSNPTGGPSIGIGTTAITILEDGDAQLSLVPTTTTVTSNKPQGSVYGQAVTFTATVSAASGAVSGAVDFVDTTTGQDLGSVPVTLVDCNGVASLTVSSLDVASHAIVAHFTGDTGSMEVSQGSVTQVVTPATLTVRADPKTMVFGATVPGLTDTITGFVNGDTVSVLSGAVSLSTTATSASGAGSYLITAGQGTLSAANYTFRILNGTLSIVPAKLTLTLVADSQTMVFGSTVPVLTDRIVGFVNGDTASVVIGAPSITTTATSASGVGTYPIDVSLGTLSAANYTFAFFGGTLTVTPATLTVTAGSATMVYGGTVPALTDTISGFVNGDTASVVSGAASLSTTATSASGVGIYANMVGLGTLSAANYTFAFADGTTTVTPVMLTVTADEKTQVYGAASPPLTDTITGFVNGDTSSIVSGAAILSTTATSASAVGNYAITVGQGSLSSPNYTFNFVNGTLRVTPATLTVTADDQTMVYGTTVPAITDTISGFVNGDTPSVITGTASLSTAATSASGVGNYPITVGLGTLSAADYTFALINGSLSVTPAVLTVTANNQTMIFGATVPTLTDTITGFVNGDTSGMVSGAADLSTTATSASDVGSYPITVGQGTLTAANYTFSFVDGTLTVSPATLTLTVTADDKTMVYGAAVPVLTDTITGFVNGDTASVVTGAASLSTTATSASGVGTYPIDVTLGTLSAANYTFTFVDATLTVTPATLTVTADNKTMVYGATVPALTDTITGFVNGDTSSAISGAASLSTTATAASGVGNYTITVGAGTLTAANYTFNFVNGTLVVTPASLTIMANNQTMTYGGSLPTLTMTYKGLANGDTPATFSTSPNVAPTVTGPATNHVGTYTGVIVASGASDPDYAISYAAGTLTVTPSSLTITANNQTMIYGGSLPTLTSTYTGLVNGDTPGTFSTSPNVAPTVTAPATNHVGTYAGAIVASGASDPDYTINYAAGTLTVTPAALTVTADNKTKVYGSANPPLTDTITGFVNGDTSSVVKGAASLSTVATSASGVGNYAINAGLGTLSAADYTFAFVSGTLSITPATLTVTADNKTKLYGATNPPLTDTITGFVNGDPSSVVSGSATLSTIATTTSGVGTYPITVGLGTLSAANYTFSSVNGVLTVNQDNSATAVGATVFGLSVTFTATVTADAPGSGTPTGSVDFFDATSNTDLGSVALSGGSASLTATLPIATQSITVSYQGDANFFASSAATSVSPLASVYVLSPSVSGALSLSGNAIIQVPGVVVDDSSSPTAITANGNVKIAAGVIDVVGGVRSTGHASFSPTPVTGRAVVADPYGKLAAPRGGTSLGDISLTGNSSLTIHPGVYTQINVSGKAKLNMASGVYVIAGGGFSVSGNASVTGSGVMIYNAGGNYLGGSGFGAVNLSGNAQIALSAPTTGPYAGVLLFQARDNQQGLTLSGNAVNGLSGTIYAASAPASLSGNATLNLPVVVDTLTLSGNAVLGAPPASSATFSGSDPAVNGFELSPLVNVAVATFVSSDASEKASAFTATIDWGDGSTSAGTITQLNNQFTASGSHTYGDEGSYSIVVSLSDGQASTTIAATAKIAEELLAEGTPGTADQRFITEIYRDVLGRQAEPQGRDYWASHLARGDSRPKVVEDILAAVTEEYHRELIQAEFARYLDRTPDPAAMQYFTGLLDGGGDATTLDAILVSSPEYFQEHGGTLDQFIDALFRDALNRPVDPAARTAVEARAAHGATRAQVVDVVFSSDEYRRDLVTAWYQQYLDRAPDAAGMADYLAQLDTGLPDEHVIATLLSSDEFVRKI